MSSREKFFNYGMEWMQSILIASSIAFISILLFIFGGFDLSTEKGRLALFLWAFVIGMIAVYLALFKWKKGTLDLFVSGF